MPIVRNAQTKAFYANCGGAPRYHPLEHVTIRACSMRSAGLFTLQDPPREKSCDNLLKLVQKH